MGKNKNLLQYLTGYNIHLLLIITIVVGLPLSKFLMSIGTLTLVAFWFLEGRIIQKFSAFFKNKAAIILSITFLIFLLGLLYTTNFEYGFKDIRLKVPLLVFPVILSSTHKLSKKHFHLVLRFFVLATLISTLYGFLVYKQLLPAKKEILEIRDISQFISHIRLSLMIVLSMFLLPVVMRKNWIQKLIGLVTVLWFAYFLSLIESATGFVIGCITLVLISIYLSFKNKSWITIVPASITILIVVFLVIKSYTTYNAIKIDTTNLEEYTSLGEKYTHESDFIMFDNGNYSQHYIAIFELEKAWEERSNYPFYEIDKSKKGYGIQYNIIRYLTSKGLRKDYNGVYQLSEEDIKNIENGTANYLQASNDLFSRLNLLMFEMDGYLEGANVNGNSFAQRLVYWRSSKEIGKQNFLFGVGTGDVGDTFEDYYKNNSELAEKFQLRSHNQYLSTFIALGFIGVVIFIFALIIPLQYAINKNNYLYVVFACIALISFFSEDTLETQDGVFFFAFFNSFFLFAKAKSHLNNKHVQ